MKDIIIRLQKISLFSSIKNNEDALNKIAKIIKIENFSQSNTIIKEGDIGDKMYILNRGEVKIEKKTLSNDQFTVVILKQDQNVFFGEIALMDNDLRSASVIAMTDIECYTIKKDDFEDLCKNNPEIGYHIIKEMAKSLSVRIRKATLDNANLIEALVSDEISS